jgi:hypothetical protein
MREESATYNVAGDGHCVDEIAFDLIENVLVERNVSAMQAMTMQCEGGWGALLAPLRRMEHDLGSSQSTKKAKGSSPI